MALTSQLLEILVCPETKAELVYDENRLVSTDPNSRRSYKIDDDIPVMLIEESKQLDKEEWSEVMKKYKKV
ncbi:hypothetical protein IT568_08560 [bacterium]|nr:hypothetical protein [bacterium]